MVKPPTVQRRALNLPSQYDAFLFAPIGDEPGGMRLTVLSALARLNLDPWEEAAHLATLPAPEAAKTLVSKLLLLPSHAPSAPDTAAVAARLVALLPSARPAPAAGEATDTGVGVREMRLNFWIAWLFFEIVLTFLAPHQGPATTDARNPASSSSVASTAQDTGTTHPPSSVNSPADPEDPAIPTAAPPQSRAR